ncbi:MFS transporter [Ammoniphilus sp. YIM 78166]|uniref:MFS transporter n=1 Tax=Ammoniphilus sp. YIM 78166 TaxID=1644106 RepID=UPI00106FF86B|nr:MFS transporter [Ammoniphilus sp. YIM 78166]
MIFYYILIMNVLNQIAFKGNKFLTTLFAIELGASPVALGILVALSSLFPLFLAFHAGRISDVFGNRLPLLCGAAGVGLGLFLPFIFKNLSILFVSQILIGAFYLFFHVAIQNLIGALSDDQSRTNNFSLFSLGGAGSGLIAPLFVGFSIDYMGHSFTYFWLSLFAFIPGVILLLIPLPLGLTREKKEKVAKAWYRSGMMELLRIAPLRKAIFTSGIILTAIGFYQFYFPIYGASIGLSASIIGIILSIYSGAFLVVRVIMPFLVRKTSEETVLASSMLFGSVPFLLMPSAETTVALSFLSFLLGLGLGAGQPLSIVLTYNHSPEGRTGEALGTRVTINKLIQVTIPLAAGFFGSTFGLMPIFLGTTVLLLYGAGSNSKILAKKTVPGEK